MKKIKHFILLVSVVSLLSHMVFISHAKEVADIIEAAAKGSLKK